MSRENTARLATRRKRIALVAHDNKKTDLLEWARFNREVLAEHALSATGTTGGLLAEALGLEVTRYRSGPLGATSRSAPRSPRGRSTCSSSSGIRLSRILMT